jgi:hypothetical protein
MLVFNNKAICFNSTAIDFDYYNWQDIHPSFIKSQTWNEAIDITSADENKGGLIIHLNNSYNSWRSALIERMLYKDWNYYYDDSAPLCYYSASNTPFVEPTPLMKPRLRRPEGMELCRAKLYRNKESSFSGQYSYSIKFSPSGNYGKNAGYYVLDDSYLTRNNINYVVEFTTAPAKSAGSGCAVWMGKLPYEYTNSAAYACFNMATYSSINNLDVKIDNRVTTSYTGKINIFCAGEAGQTKLTGLNNVKIEQKYTSGGLNLVSNTDIDYMGADTYDYFGGSLGYCNNVSSNAPLCCSSVSYMNNCTNIVTGNPYRWNRVTTLTSNGGDISANTSGGYSGTTVTLSNTAWDYQIPGIPSYEFVRYDITGATIYDGNKFDLFQSDVRVQGVFKEKS